MNRAHTCIWTRVIRLNINTLLKAYDNRWQYILNYVNQRLFDIFNWSVQILLTTGAGTCLNQHMFCFLSISLIINLIFYNFMQTKWNVTLKETRHEKLDKFPSVNKEIKWTTKKVHWGHKSVEQIEDQLNKEIRDTNSWRKWRRHKTSHKHNSWSKSWSTAQYTKLKSVYQNWKSTEQSSRDTNSWRKWWRQTVCHKLK